MKIILTEEQLKHIIKEISTSEIDAECKNVNLDPTDAQKEAGNYKMGHFYIKGMPISIENPIGSKRKYKDENGNEGFVIMRNHYGYFTNTTGNGKDGDAVDVFIGPNPEGFEKVYVIDQNNKDGEFDESKVMIGFNSKEESKKAYLSNYNKGWDGFRAITGVSLRLFKKWLYRGNKQRKPFSEYVEIQKRKLEEINNNDMKVILNENQLKKIVLESVKRIMRESLEGDDFEDVASFDKKTPNGNIHEKLLSMGVKEVPQDAYQNLQRKIEDNVCRDGEPLTLEDLSMFLSQSGLQTLENDIRHPYTHVWMIDVDGKTYCSRHNFRHEAEAERNCNKYIYEIETMGYEYYATIESIFKEDDGEYGMDTMLCRSSEFDEWID